MSFFKEIKEKISKMPHGEVFVVSDFAHIAGEKTISKILQRLCGINYVEKIIRGVFWIPGDLSSPEPVSVASALARANNWHIAPSGECALYLFGLSKTPPKVWRFVTDGTYRNYKLGENVIAFCHTSGKMLSDISEQTALLIQVLKAYGKEYNYSVIAEKIRKYSDEEKKRILSETKNATRWISDSIKKLIAEA